MVLEHWDAGGRIERAQQNSMNLSEVSAGYSKQVEDAFAGKSAAAVRNEIQKFVEPVLQSEGEEQYEALQKLLKRLEPFRDIFADVDRDPDERAAFALALVNREKSLQ